MHSALADIGEDRDYTANRRRLNAAARTVLRPAAASGPQVKVFETSSHDFDAVAQRRYRLAAVKSKIQNPWHGHESFRGGLKSQRVRSGVARVFRRGFAILHIPRALLIALALSGCAPRTTQFEIMDHRAGAEPERYFEGFEECYYSLDRQGRLDLVARRVSPPAGELAEEIIQVVHVHGSWRATPGRTYADGSMLNATVSYWIVSGRRGAGFEGAGFVSFNEDRWKSTAAGKLELAKLAPHRRFGEGPALFDRGELTGEFKAVRDQRGTVRILNEMRRRFGPMPRYEPPLGGNDLL